MISAVEQAKRELDRAIAQVPESRRAGVTVRRAQHQAIEALGEFESAVALIKFAQQERSK